MHFCNPWQLGRKCIASTADDRFSFRFWIWQFEHINSIFMLIGKLCFPRHAVFQIQNIKINKTFMHFSHCLLTSWLICRFWGGLLRGKTSLSLFYRYREVRQRHLHIKWAEGRQHSQGGALLSLGAQLLVLLLHPTPAHASWGNVFNSPIC